ncbi:uncharacterized protein LOC128864186 [Anastrepha ludens]|uniref:uncharacterized protein LOC128864186 n=1 Tax=Anastrepha ludens TaxID=28586 RepID=UPI0023AF679C|nr:uncharacterized protein LOC128864186 [Anastrepha ludens]
MERLEGTDSSFCATGAPKTQCLCSEKQRFLNLIYNEMHSDSKAPTPHIELYDKNSWHTFVQVMHILLTIVPIVFFFAIARIVGQKLEYRIPPNSSCGYAIEFLLIVVPTVLIVNVFNNYIGQLMVVFWGSLLGLMYVVYKSKNQRRWYVLGGHRPIVLTLLRAAINLLTALCILAVDFESFPKNFRKTRRYGAGLMDVGIGLFVFAMGTVSKPSKNIAHITKSLWTVVLLLVLGLGRTLLIMFINYNQDEHEYGLHLNAFYTLALTKFFGCLFSGIAKNNLRHMIAGVALLIIHECCLQLYTSAFVMNPDIERDTFLRANREGILSLPGFVALYLISIVIGQSLKMQDKALRHRVFIDKLRALGIASVVLWVLVVGCIFTVSIARVTCNLGYVTWILALAVTMAFLFIIVFHLILSTIWPICDIEEDFESLLNSTVTTSCHENSLPALVKAVNANGLVFFLLANVLTGAVNIYLEPSVRSDFESICILTVYMFIAISFVYLLHRLKIRIA